MGDLPGEYYIVTDDAVPPVVHPPRRVPVALRNQIKEKLDEMVASDVITPVTRPTEWVASMLVIVKPNKLRICLDPRDLNKAIRREHYQLPTAENLLQPNSDLKTTARSLAARKRQQCKQCKEYNRGTKNLVPLKVGEVIRMRNYLGNRNGA